MARGPADFAPIHRYAGVILQQGRVRLDADWNPVVGRWPARVIASFGHGIGIEMRGHLPPDQRRLTSQIEKALYSGLAWAVFEPNGPQLWTQLRVAAANYLMSLYQMGELVGATPDQAFFVRCDASTTTQFEISSGEVNVIVGFAPVYPAEFVLLVIGLTTGTS